MYVTLVGFKWDNDKDRKWLTNYFSDDKRQPKSDIEIPSIKGIRSKESSKRFERFFDALRGGNDDDKKLRKNTISAWKSKLKQQNNYRQLNIDLTPEEYEQLIKLKDLNGYKSTIKNTILDLIYDEYQVQENMLMSLEDKLRKEITRELRSENREKVIKKIADKESKASRQRNTCQINTDSLLMEKFDALAKETNTKFEELALLITTHSHNKDSLEEQPLSVNAISQPCNNQPSALASTEKADNLTSEKCISTTKKSMLSSCKTDQLKYREANTTNFPPNDFFHGELP